MIEIDHAFDERWIIATCDDHHVDFGPAELSTQEGHCKLMGVVDTHIESRHHGLEVSVRDNTQWSTVKGVVRSTAADGRSGHTFATDDAVGHPAHYTSHPSGVECITITEHFGFNIGNAIKYLWRAGLKSPDAREDLRKALQYVQFEINRLGRETKP